MLLCSRLRAGSSFPNFPFSYRLMDSIFLLFFDLVWKRICRFFCMMDEKGVEERERGKRGVFLDAVGCLGVKNVRAVRCVRVHVGFFR